MAHMQQAGEGSHPVELLVAHDAQIVDIALHLAQLGGEGIDFIAVTECDHPALQGILQHNAHPTASTVNWLKRHSSSWVSRSSMSPLAKKGCGEMTLSID